MFYIKAFEPMDSIRSRILFPLILPSPAIY